MFVNFDDTKLKAILIFLSGDNINVIILSVIKSIKLKI